MATQKQSNYRRYITLCDEDLKQKTYLETSDNQFGEHYIGLRHLGIEYNGQDFHAYLTINTQSDTFELFILFAGYKLHRTSQAEGNLERWLDNPEFIVSIACDVMRREGGPYPSKALDIVE